MTGVDDEPGERGRHRPLRSRALRIAAIPVVVPILASRGIHEVFVGLTVYILGWGNAWR